MIRIHARAVRYIKLGPQNAWADDALARGIIPFGDAEDRHDLASAGHWEALADGYRSFKPRTQGVVTDLVRTIRTFYTAGEDDLWITFAHGRLWWAFAGAEVMPTQEPSPATGACYRRTLGGWSDRNVQGEQLRIRELSSRLTKTASYQKTICDVKERDLLLRKINGEINPIVRKASKARNALADTAIELIGELDQADFEVMTDLIFSRSGWRRTTLLGETQADIDLALENPTTGERAFVQVKSAATQSVLEDYIDRFRKDGSFERFYFVCHSPRGKLTAPTEANVHVWTGAALANAAIEAGLIDWLMKKVA